MDAADPGHIMVIQTVIVNIQSTRSVSHDICDSHIRIDASDRALLRSQAIPVSAQGGAEHVVQGSAVQASVASRYSSTPKVVTLRCRSNPYGRQKS